MSNRWGSLLNTKWPAFRSRGIKMKVVISRLTRTETQKLYLCKGRLFIITTTYNMNAVTLISFSHLLDFTAHWKVCTCIIYGVTTPFNDEVLKKENECIVQVILLSVFIIVYLTYKKTCCCRRFCVYSAAAYVHIYITWRYICIRSMWGGVEETTNAGAKQGHPSHVLVGGRGMGGVREGFSATIMWKFNHLHTWSFSGRLITRFGWG